MKHTTLFFALCASLTACGVKEVLDDAPGTKSPVALSVGGVDAPDLATKSVITDGSGKSLNPFDVDTKIFMVMKSEYGQDDFSGDHGAKYNVARGDVKASESSVTFDALNQRYWDDAHGRSSMLSVYAYAQKGQNWFDATFNGNKYETSNSSLQPFAWTTSEIVPVILTWAASNQAGGVQNQTTVQAQDLLFSNNLADNGSDKDGRLKFNFSTRKFPQAGEANMIFYHAMSKVVIRIVEGDGFNKSSDNDFKFTTAGGNVILKQFNHTGKFDIRQGEFTEISSSADIPSIYLKSSPATADVKYELEALAVPSIAADGASRFVDGRNDLASDVMMEFAIDNNKYQITHEDLFEALKGKENATVVEGAPSYIPLEAGKKYVFTFTVGKAKVRNISAQVAEWEEIVADNMAPTSARIKLQLEERGSAVTEDATFWKSEDNNAGDGIDDDYTVYNWKTGYTNMGASYSDGHWTTDLFWANNKNFFHFRALMPASTAVTVDGSGEGDHAVLASAASYSDVRWGAPMKDDGDNETSGSFKWTYDPAVNGFDNAGHTQIYKAIGPTEDPVKLILFHMMSDVTFNIKTTAGPDAVVLADGAKKTTLEIVGFYPGGKVLLGNGLVKTTGTATETRSVDWSSESSGVHVYKYGVVPQGLTAVKLYITTPDGNRYIVDMKDVKAASVSTANIANPYQQEGGKYVINRWYPGFRYVYTFNLSKKKIEDITATVLDWETVIADEEEVQIK